jgi:hypothetical protein
MWAKSYSKVYPDVKRANAWQVWSDVKNWPRWDKELQSSQIASSFTNGSRYIVKYLHGPKVTLTLLEVIANKKFTDFGKFFGATLYETHELEDTPDGLRILVTTTLLGPLSMLWALLIGKHIERAMPKQIDTLALLAKVLR